MTREVMLFVRYEKEVAEKVIGFNDIETDDYGVGHNVYKEMTDPAHLEIFQKIFQYEDEAKSFADKVNGEVYCLFFENGIDQREVLRYRASGCGRSLI